MTIACVYEIVSLSGKRYIGGAVNWTGRKSVHVHHLRKGVHHNAPLQAAYNKYGEEGLDFRPLFICECYQVRYWEQKALNSLDHDYNISICADDGGGMKGRHHSEESKRRIGDANRGQDTSKAVEASVAARTGKPLSDEHRAKIKNALKGRVSPTKGMKFPNRKSPSKSGFTGKKHTAESKVKMKASALARWKRKTS